MTRKQKILVGCLIAAILLAGGKYSAMIMLTALAPVYAWLLSSIFLIVFLVLAAVVVPMGQKIIERRERLQKAHLKEERKTA